MTTTVYRSLLRTGWIVQSDAMASFRIDQAELTAVVGHLGDRLATIAPTPIVVSDWSLEREGDIPLVIDDLVSDRQHDQIFLGLTDESWLAVPFALIRALADCSPAD